MVLSVTSVSPSVICEVQLLLLLCPVVSHVLFSYCDSTQGFINLSAYLNSYKVPKNFRQ